MINTFIITTTFQRNTINTFEVQVDIFNGTVTLGMRKLGKQRSTVTAKRF